MYVFLNEIRDIIIDKRRTHVHKVIFSKFVDSIVGRNKNFLTNQEQESDPTAVHSDPISFSSKTTDPSSLSSSSAYPAHRPPLPPHPPAERPTIENPGPSESRNKPSPYYLRNEK